ncbi:MAG: DoxX family protein [Planctomycetota bacterium]|nr:DoxX family protein [Planctomycetota bacterium]
MSSSKTSRTIGWVLCALVSFLLIVVSGVGKFYVTPETAEMFEKLGYSPELMKKIGVLEIAITLLFLIPRTSFLGAILVTGYLGGATATHLRVGDPFVFPVIVGVVMWIGLGLRRPEIFAMTNCCVRTDAGRHPEAK